MESINTEYIRNKLSKYGITFSDFQTKTGNLIGRVIVPLALRAFNSDLTAEDAFYFVANKVFENANVLCHGIPGLSGDDWYRIVSYEDYKSFQKAIYEEINQRFLSNTFPEFQSAGSTNISNVSVQNGFIGGESTTQWVNSMSRQILANIDWEQYVDHVEHLKQKVYLYRNMENAWLPPSTDQRFIVALEDGSVGYKLVNDFATYADIVLAGEQIQKNWEQQVENKSEINKLKEQAKTFATKEFVNQVATAFPTTEVWNPDKTYHIPSFVEYGGSIYWNIIEDNLNNVPGGITGQNKWKKMTDVYVGTQATDVIYAPGTDFKQGTSNPNHFYYVSIGELIMYVDPRNSEGLFNYLDAQFPHLNLTIDDTNVFFENLCNSDFYKLIEMYSSARKVRFHENTIMLFDSYFNLQHFMQLNNISSGQATLLDYNESYVRFGNSNTNIVGGGSNYLKRSDLPNLKFSFEFTQHWFDNYYAPCYFSYSNTFVRDSRNGTGWDFQTKKGQTYNVKEVGFYLNGNLSQTKFEPQYLFVFALKFNTDIYETQYFEMYVNVVQMSVEGKIVKSLHAANNNYDEHDHDYLYYQSIRENVDSFSQIIIKTDEKHDLALADAASLKTYIDKLFKSIKRKVFLKNEIRLFDTMTAFNDIKAFYKLIEGTDYQVIETDRYLLTGNKGFLNGSNYLKKSNLPKTNLDVNGKWDNGLTNNTQYSEDTNPVRLKRALRDASYQQEGVVGKISLNNDDQTEFKPKYVEVYAVKFLKDIER